MAGSGIFTATYDSSYQDILDALARASEPQLIDLARFLGEELLYISEKAFEKEKDPVTGATWERLKNPRGSGAKLPGGKKTILRDHGILHDSLTHNDSKEGTVFGSHLIYARIHQKGGEAGRGKKSIIPARPYMGVPKDFDRVLLDPAVLDLLKVRGGV
jgi:phage virion morphogenesis protein